MVTHREYEEAVETIDNYLSTYEGEDYIYDEVESDLENLIWWVKMRSPHRSVGKTEKAFHCHEGDSR